MSDFTGRAWAGVLLATALGWAIPAAAQIHGALVTAGHAPSQCLSPDGAKAGVGSGIVTWACDPKFQNERWTLVAIAPNATVLRHDLSQLCVSVAGGSRNWGARLVLEACNAGNLSQRWTYTAAQNFYNPHFAVCMDVDKARAENGSPVIMHGCNPNANQKFIPGAAIPVLASTNLAVRLYNAMVCAAPFRGPEGAEPSSGVGIAPCLKGQWSMDGAHIKYNPENLCLTMFQENSSRVGLTVCGTVPRQAFERHGAGFKFAGTNRCLLMDTKGVIGAMTCTEAGMVLAAGDKDLPK
jgi:hypothetical protein